METPLEIRYEGVVIDRIKSVSGTMEQGGVLQLVTNEPMPVGTRLELCAGSEVSYVRVVRVTEAPAPNPSTMHVRAVGLSEPFEVTLLPNPEYSGEHRSEPAPPRPPPLPVEPTPEPTPVPIVQTAGDGEAVPEAIGADPSLNGAGDHDEISGLHDTNASSEYPSTGNGANNKRRRRRRR